MKQKEIVSRVEVKNGTGDKLLRMEYHVDVKPENKEVIRRLENTVNQINGWSIDE